MADFTSVISQRIAAARPQGMQVSPRAGTLPATGSSSQLDMNLGPLGDLAGNWLSDNYDPKTIRAKGALLRKAIDEMDEATANKMYADPLVQKEMVKFQKYLRPLMTVEDGLIKFIPSSKTLEERAARLEAIRTGTKAVQAGTVKTKVETGILKEEAPLRKKGLKAEVSLTEEQVKRMKVATEEIQEKIKKGKMLLPMEKKLIQAQLDTALNNIKDQINQLELHPDQKALLNAQFLTTLEGVRTQRAQTDNLEKALDIKDAQIRNYDGQVQKWVNDYNLAKDKIAEQYYIAAQKQEREDLKGVFKNYKTVYDNLMKDPFAVYMDPAGVAIKHVQYSRSLDEAIGTTAVEYATGDFVKVPTVLVNPEAKFWLNQSFRVALSSYEERVKNWENVILEALGLLKQTYSLVPDKIYREVPALDIFERAAWESELYKAALSSEKIVKLFSEEEIKAMRKLINDVKQTPEAQKFTQKFKHEGDESEFVAAIKRAIGR